MGILDKKQNGIMFMQDTMPYGKYRGKQLQYIIEDDPQYVDWAINEGRIQICDDAYSLLMESMERHNLETRF